MSTLKAAPRKPVALKDLHPNPWRDLETNPLDHDRVVALAKSIAVNGWWGNIHVRPAPDGKGYEVAYGQHRVVSLREDNGPNTEVEVMVQNLSDAEMIRFMADENLEGAGGDALTDIQLVGSVIKAYGDGRIDLPAVSTNTDPHYIKEIAGKRGRTAALRYTASTVAQFLRWVDPGRNTSGVGANHRCDTAFDAWHMIQDGLLDLKALKGLKKQHGRLTREDVEHAIVTSKDTVAREKSLAFSAEHFAKEAQTNGDTKTAAKFAEKAKEFTPASIKAKARAASNDALARKLDTRRRAAEDRKIVKSSVKRLTDRKPKEERSVYGWIDTLIEDLKKVRRADEFTVRLDQAYQLAGTINPRQLQRLQAAISEAAEFSEERWSQREKDWASPFKIKTVTPIKRALPAH